MNFSGKRDDGVLVSTAIDEETGQTYERYRHMSYFRSTTWLTVLDATGDIQSIVAEELTGEPTAYPVDEELDGHSASYHAFIMAQQGGKHAARDFARRCNPLAREHDRNNRAGKREVREADRKVISGLEFGKYRRKQAA